MIAGIAIQTIIYTLAKSNQGCNITIFHTNHEFHKLPRIDILGGFVAET